MTTNSRISSFVIVNFMFLYSNIPLAAAHEVYISLLICCLRFWVVSVHGFIDKVVRTQPQVVWAVALQQSSPPSSFSPLKCDLPNKIHHKICTFMCSNTMGATYWEVSVYISGASDITLGFQWVSFCSVIRLCFVECRLTFGHFTFLP